MNAKSLARTAINRAGFDVIRVRNSPKRTLLGMVRLGIGTVIDVGANEGQFARMISGIFPNTEIYCFEPLSGPFQKLITWAQTQNGRVRCFQTALGDQQGEVDMYLHEQHTPSSSLLSATEMCHTLYPQTRAKRIERVKASTLDHVLANSISSTEKPALLKLDVQGFEDRVLRGAQEVLSQCKVVILEVSVEPLYNGQAEFLDLAFMLRDSGHKYVGNLDQAYGDDGRVVYFDAVFWKD